MHRYIISFYISVITAFVAFNTEAADVYQKIHVEAAKQGQCSEKNPCLIQVHKQDKDFSVFVQRSVGITEYGALQFTTSALWISFDKNGNFVNATPTP